MRRFSVGEARRNSSYEAEAKSLERDLAMVRPRPFRGKAGLGQGARIQSERTRHKRAASYGSAISIILDRRAPLCSRRRERANPRRITRTKPSDEYGQGFRQGSIMRARRGSAASHRATTRE